MGKNQLDASSFMSIERQRTEVVFCSVRHNLSLVEVVSNVAKISPTLMAIKVQVMHRFYSR